MIRQMNKMVELLEETNAILKKVEGHLYNLTLPPDMKAWSKFQKENKDDPYFKGTNIRRII